MSFVITGLSPRPFQHLFGLPDDLLDPQNIVRRTVHAKPGFPCRITLEDAEPGETVLLLNYESHSVPTPYASRYAIYVRESATQASTFRGELPPVLTHRPIALRLFDVNGMLVGADLGLNADLKAKIEQAFARSDVSYIHAHNAKHGCFAAEVRRDL
ncbi:MAG: DUF1203 domain-containing protein [Alphaproteobacteria bacterium HGW-Alphaproteobacteria-18]|nr:MAG: DUF1203 domain-containing protein [Alphaproteobacteria bacterium HGW-Alphaproteobacteria-18]